MTWKRKKTFLTPQALSRAGRGWFFRLHLVAEIKAVQSAIKVALRESRCCSAELCHIRRTHNPTLIFRIASTLLGIARRQAAKNSSKVPGAWYSDWAQCLVKVSKLYVWKVASPGAFDRQKLGRLRLTQSHLPSLDLLQR